MNFIKNSVILDASIYLGMNVLSSFMPFMLLPLFARTLTSSEFGQISIFEALVAVFNGIAGLSTHGAIGVRYYSGKSEKFSRYIGVCLITLFINTFLILIIISVLQDQITNFLGISLLQVILALVCASAQFIYNIRLTVWQVAREPFKYGIFQAGQSTFSALISGVLVIHFIHGANGRIIGIFVSALLFAVLAVISLRRNRMVAWQWNNNDFIDVMKFGVPLIPHAIGGITVAYVDRIVLLKQLGLEATGIYFVAMQLSMPIVLIGGSVNRAFVPWLYKQLHSKNNLTAVAMSYAMMFTFILLGIIYSIVLYFCIEIILGKEYASTRWTVIVLIFGTTFQAAYYAVVNYLFYLKKTAILSLITIVTSGLQIVAMFLIAPIYGLMGVALTFSFTQFLTFGAVWGISARVNPQPWNRFNSAILIIKNSVSTHFEDYHETR